MVPNDEEALSVGLYLGVVYLSPVKYPRIVTGYTGKHRIYRKTPENSRKVEYPMETGQESQEMRRKRPDRRNIGTQRTNTKKTRETSGEIAL